MVARIKNSRFVWQALDLLDGEVTEESLDHFRSTLEMTASAKQLGDLRAGLTTLVDQLQGRLLTDDDFPGPLVGDGWRAAAMAIVVRGKAEHARVVASEGEVHVPWPTEFALEVFDAVEVAFETVSGATDLPYHTRDEGIVSVSVQDRESIKETLPTTYAAILAAARVIESDQGLAAALEPPGPDFLYIQIWPWNDRFDTRVLRTGTGIMVIVDFQMDVNRPPDTTAFGIQIIAEAVAAANKKFGIPVPPGLKDLEGGA
ncbi:hypothetical protein [Cellulomonas sp. PhB143]|uniref:hypothetical protein n=1 Tax=Cellulomonas sp. PhB143 TaxID=2485186 RepID=UPI000F47A3B7|nr:hypothetical protein [Cellulomonas sp. PhB143]ROS78899.1 hypothetical protein EDF32_0809 [Cellulomonas sp. PhB143]